MKLSSVFKNRAKCAVAVLPAVTATVVASSFSGLEAVIPSVVAGTLTILGFRALDNLVHDKTLLTPIEPTERWKEIAKDMGVWKMPRIYRHESSVENAHVAYGSIVMESFIMDNHLPDEIDDTFAHELAHIKRRDGLAEPLARHVSMYSIACATYSLYNVVFFNDGAADALNHGIAFLGYGASAFIATPIALIDSQIIEENHEMEFDCDRRAVEATGNVGAGIRKLRHFQEGGDYDEQGCFTHPSTNSRIRALEAIIYQKEVQPLENSLPAHGIT